jgi:SagB-type dehydrogenase family enzyme
MTQRATEPMGGEDRKCIEAVLAYHRRTKHHLHRYAASPGFLDWANQPDPYRTYAGAEVIELPLLADRLDADYTALYSPGAVAKMPLERDTIAMLFELALGLSAVKEYKGSRWALRCNPSSGNLHPTEGYAILPEVSGMRAGAYHYVSRDHCFERRCVLDDQATRELGRLLPPDSFLVGLSSIHWREAWKYGERAFRYCQHDAGHAIATVRYAAAVLGWSARLIADVSDASIADMLGLTDPESFRALAPEDREHPDALLLVGPALPQGDGADTGGLDTTKLRDVLHAGRWRGLANALCSSHVHWSAIDAAAGATWRANGAASTRRADGPRVIVERAARPVHATGAMQASAVKLIKQRRSCLALDGSTSISAETFHALLDRLIPRPGVPPWDAWPWPPHVHCGIFVHRVRGVPPGLYVFERSSAVHNHLRTALGAGLSWKRPVGCPEDLPLFELFRGDLRAQSRTVSCHQEIASDGAFSLGMIAEFSDGIAARGAWWYRRLFWESGMLGQVLYLEAEAAGVRGTGIGCYFDDAFHQLLGLEGDRFASLYHFTIGGPVDDPRLATLSPYAHLQKPRALPLDPFPG